MNLIRLTDEFTHESNDFCLNGRNCKIIFEYGYRKFVKKIDCKCPNKQSLINNLKN